ncbi:unnamed protein product [Miscanthus lutarioriparius]|uniref:NB-ARC domain-containing protein n=1 Tax=Miscanthus lutarioriparius TaxID=422564 RepID=A0A811NGA2_9POAL|nr:unnamed protein product [Miscanthus lutarioriparius]
MGSGATKREILEKKLEKRLQDPKTEPLISLPLDFLEDITCGFSTERVLGTGGFGVVYKGVLRSGKTIAVKNIFDKHLLDNDNRFENEIICLTEVVGSWRNRLIEITPMHMSPEMCIQQVQQCISIALKCLEPESNKRPTSLDIVQSLNAVEPKCTSPGNPPSVVEKKLAYTATSYSLISMRGGINWIYPDEHAKSITYDTSGLIFVDEVQSGAPECRLEPSNLGFQLAGAPLSHEWCLYDAEDLLDEFRWYEKKVSVEGNAISVEPIIKFFQSVTQGNFNKVTGIQKRLNNLSKQLEKQGLLPAIPKFDKSSRPETSFFSTEAKMIGRDEEKKKLIMLLGVPTNKSSGRSGCKRKRRVSSSTSNQVCATIDSNEATIVSVRVLPIVGIGGVGKTTLAQDICNHSKVKGHFDLIIWICVSDDFDVKRLTKEAIEQTSGEVLENGNLNSLQLALANSVNKKRFLIVLDDMWDENEEHWKHLCAPFKNAFQGSMMLVTTRSPKVADVVRTMDSFPLEGLKDDVFRKFFKSCVFGPNSSNIDPKLERIGEKILPKLRGSPLAAKTLGRLLGMSLELAHWDRILKSQLWELQQKETDILPALRLSYMYFIVFKEMLLILCCVPERLHIQKGGFSGDLGGRRLSGTSHWWSKYPRSHKKYVIHDLMHDMAQLVSKDECFIVKEKNDIPKIPQNVRHLSVVKGGDIQCSDLLKNDMARLRKLRTLFCHLSLKSEADNTVMEKWCNELLCMRVMVCSISKWGLPGNISNMKLLRYLQILDSSLCKSLPSAFCCLYNMQIFNATKWSIDDIPSGFGMLINNNNNNNNSKAFGMLINLQKFESVKCQFHHIHSVGTLKGATDQGQKSQFELINYNGDSLPNSQQVHSYDSTNSTLLSVTDVVIHSCQNLSSLKQFLQPGYVPTIKNIEISDCGSLESVPADRFGDLHFLEVLSVSKCPNIKSRRLFAPSLKKLYLEDSGDLGYKNECSSLTILHLSNCPLESIELQMCNLRLLQELKIRSCPSLTVIRDSEPISSDILHGEARSRAIDNTFLSLTDLPKLIKPRTILQPAYVPIIKKIEIYYCRSLQSVPTDMFGDLCFLGVLRVSHCPLIKSEHLFAPSLKELYLVNSGNLGGNIECSSLTILQLSDCLLEAIELQVRNLPLLQNLEIIRCSSLTIIRDSEPISTDLFHGGAQSRMGKFPLLAHLTIVSCEKLKTIDDLLYLPAVERISITDFGLLLSLLAHRLGSFPRLKDLKISACQGLNWQSGMLLARSLQKLTLWNCGDFSAWLPSCLENLTFLESLEIRDCECIVSVPGHLWSSNLRSLQRLMFYSCSKLKSIGGPGTITHIRDLCIDDCPELKEIDQPLRRGSFL